jgi:GalNAc-alpha-(1->4)-GalNAc-alpha-(1->3)-diNAcBac-PP-undecaprenol alpha-1,4-N-acetyl-D-galactosaminyltransferase
LRIAFVIPSLGPGGAERVASLLCNDWVRQGHAVTLATFDAAGAEPFFTLENGVVIRDLPASTSRGLAARLGANITRISRLRSLLRQFHPDVVVSFMTEANVVALRACRGLGVPVVISERNQPDRPGLGRLRKLARRLSYPLASAMVVQTEAIASWARARFRIPIHVIPNPVQIGPSGTRYRSDVHQLVALGRLTHQKGFDVLVKSFAAVAGKHPSWRLVIYGEGPDRSLLERLRTGYGLDEKISLPGLTKDSAGVLRRAGLFALPSRFEGYPNALLEALACGLPVIATACPGGTSEILANGRHGMLVPPDDISAMAAALDAMMSASDLREAYASQARLAAARLDSTVVSKRWLDLLASLSGQES